MSRVGRECARFGLRVVHPVQSVIESLYAAGRCPRIHVNALAEGVVCPDFIREQWGERLIIDLDPSYPLDLTFAESHLEADLSFGGYVSRCIFPYDHIYVVADRNTGRGIVLDQNMPESIRRGRYVPPAARKSPDEGEGSRKLRPLEGDGGAKRQRAGDAAPLGETRDDGPADAAKATDEDARKRRAAFRVIDGGS